MAFVLLAQMQQWIESQCIPYGNMKGLIINDFSLLISPSTFFSLFNQFIKYLAL